MSLNNSFTLAVLSSLLFACGSDSNTEETEVKGLIDHSAEVDIPNYDLLKSGEDTVSYCMGLEAANNLKSNYAGVDFEAFKNAFNAYINNEATNYSVEEADEMVEAYNDKVIHEMSDSLSYSLGINLGSNIKNKFPPLSIEVFFEAVQSELESKALIIPQMDAAKHIEEYYLKETASNFLEENAKKPGVAVMPSGLQYKTLREGDGEHPVPGSEVTVHYEGKLVDGTVFDSSYERKVPASFPLTNVIRGWQEGIPLMAEGAKYEFYIPYYLAYGERGTQGIPPYSTLIFKVELMKTVE